MNSFSWWVFLISIILQFIGVGVILGKIGEEKKGKYDIGQLFFSLLFAVLFSIAFCLA